MIVHEPKTPEKHAEIRKLAAKVHGQYIALYVSNLPCPIMQKIQLIDAAGAAILERYKASEKVKSKRK